MDWIYLAGDIADDAALEEVTEGRIQELIDRIRDTLPFLPEKVVDDAMELVYPLDTTLGVMATGQNATIEFEDGKNAMLPLMQGCPGVSLKGYKPLGSGW